MRTIFLALALFLIASEIQSKPKVGFFVEIKQGKKYFRLETQSLAEAYTFVQNNSPEFCMDIEEILKYSTDFSFYAQNKEISFYLMEVTSKGKYKMIPKRKLSKYNKFLFETASINGEN